MAPKKKSKKGKAARLRAEALLRAQQEEEARLERERLYRELVERLEAKYEVEKESELAQYNSLAQKFLSAKQWKMDYREQAKWEHYLSCDGAPDPTVPQEINTFMSLWRDEQDQDVQLVMEKGEVVLHLIEKLQFLLLETAPEDITDEKQEQYLQVILQLQDLLHQKYNDATQSLLKVASMYEDSESGNMHTVLKDINVTFCLWANLKMKVRYRQDTCSEAGHAFELPMSLALSSVAVRVLYTRYDHVSPLWVQCQGLPRQEGPATLETAEQPQDTGQGSGEEEEEEGTEEPSVPAAEKTVPNQRKSSASLKETSNNKDDIKETQEETEKNSENLEEPSQEGAQLPQVGNKESEEEAPLQEEPGGGEEAPRVVDLEQLVPVGGVFHISVLRLPPQAQDVGDWIMVELLDVGLEEYPYSPGKAEDGTQEAVQITLRLPDNVIYFEVPVLARWDPAGQWWRTDGISKITYEAEEKRITFSMGGFSTVALLQDAHLNLPYQAWELHPTGVDEGLFTVTAAFATIQIQIKDNQCMLSSVVVEEKEVLSHITGKWMSPVALRAALKRAGVNIFPAEHSPKYVPVPRKGPLAEVRAYEQMALLAAAFAFAHSKWNGEAGPEQVVFKVSEHLTAGSAKGSHWSLLMFDGEKVQHLKLTETSEAFSEEVQEESEFHSTLYHMVKEFASNEAMEKVERAGCMFIDSVYQLLLATRVLAYS
ncbi:dynein axonemal intermediate chain 7-like [Zonotrichia leucophrys gambelii]|uniref:dynein axonemal intermediate chain 7-like n=1 Tax=Zonotrichia leucophrys gambelii TaxID=257770 RepID=UPI003140936D